MSASPKSLRKVTPDAQTSAVKETGGRHADTDRLRAGADRRTDGRSQHGTRAGLIGRTE